MKKQLLSYILFTFLISNCLTAQVINFPDNNLKTALLNHQPVIDTNNDNEIQIAEANAFTPGLYLQSDNISDATGLEHFTQIPELVMDYNNLTDFSINTLQNLTYLSICFNDLVTMDLSNLTALESLVVTQNDLTMLDVSSLVNLEYLNMRNNPLEELDVSNNPQLDEITLIDLPNMLYLNLKNGNMANIMSNVETFDNMLNLQMVCVDDIPTFFNNLYDEDEWGFSPWFTVTTDCNFTPSQVNNIFGDISYDENNDNCSSSTAVVPNILVQSTVNGSSYASMTNSLGNHTIYAEEDGQNIVNIVSSLPDFFSFSPENLPINFSDFGNTIEASFCISSTASVDDLNVGVYSLNSPIPGEAMSCLVYVENMGTTDQSGTFQFSFDDSKLSFQGASPTESASTANSLTFNFNNLSPLRQQTFQVDFMVASTPNVNIGEGLDLGIVNALGSDVNTEDNSHQIYSEVVNTFSSNMKMVMEGEEILLEDADQYLHYLIRFQNNGTENAQNLSITETLSDNLDWSTLRVAGASHNHITNVFDGNQVEFQFNGINLPTSSTDAEASQGYIAYKVKPKETVALGDVMQGDASINFDNEPAILTNTASTTIVENLNTENFDLSEAIKLYPNPTSGKLNISVGNSVEILSVEVYSITGQFIMKKTESSELDLASFPSGMYFVKLQDNKGQVSTHKVLKK